MRISDWSSDVCSSDLGPTIKRGYLDAIVRRVNGLDSDLIALTGDIVDGHIDRLRRHVAPLSELRSRHGSYRSEEHTSELQSLMRISYAVFCLKKKKPTQRRLQDNLTPLLTHIRHTHPNASKQ